MAIIGDEAAAARADAGVVPLSGFVQFDEPNLATGGKAFLPDGEVSRFKKIGDLDPAVLWITNLGSADEPLRRRRHFRCSAFLGPRAQAIDSHLGLEVHPAWRLRDGSPAPGAGRLDTCMRWAST